MSCQLKPSLVPLLRVLLHLPLKKRLDQNNMATPGTIDSGHTAWLLVSMALVQLMLPGLAFFYAGLLRPK